MPVKAATKSTAAPRKRRTRKTTAKTVTPVTKQTTIKKEVKTVTVKTPVRPSTLLKSSDYINDIKIRFDIHNYEVNALINDIKWSYNQVRDYVVSVYNREFATKYTTRQTVHKHPTRGVFSCIIIIVTQKPFETIT